MTGVSTDYKNSWQWSYNPRLHKHMQESVWILLRNQCGRQKISILQVKITAIQREVEWLGLDVGWWDEENAFESKHVF